MKRLTLDKLAWIRLDSGGRVLTARNRGREVVEELSVAVVPDTVRHFGAYELLAANAAIMRMTCYFADYVGALAAAKEIEEVASGPLVPEPNSRHSSNG